MTKLVWDAQGERFFENGVDHGVLYLADEGGAYSEGYVWNGLTAVTESPSGAESNKQYADNRVYANLLSAEEFGATVEAYTYPDAFAQCDGTAVPTPGVMVAQQNRRSFGLSYRTKLGNDADSDFAYKLHLVYNALAAPSERAYNSLNDSPDLTALSWTLSTTPIDIEGVNPVTGKPFKPTALLTIVSKDVDAAALAVLEQKLYGTEGTDPMLPTPTEVIAIFSGTVNTVSPDVPTYNSSTKVITIPTVTGVTYRIDGKALVPGVQAPITKDTLVTATADKGYTFPPVVDVDWLFKFA